jgi:hypothetical protein
MIVAAAPRARARAEDEAPQEPQAADDQGDLEGVGRERERRRFVGWLTMPRAGTRTCRRRSSSLTRPRSVRPSQGELLDLLLPGLAS